MLHYDGNAWQEQLVGASDDLIALWGTGPDNIVAIGGRSSAVVSHFDGNDWRSERLDSVPGANGVWMRQENVAHVALTQGYLGKLSVPELEIELVEWDDNLDFHSIFGTSDGTLSAVGGNFEAFFTGEFEGLLVERHLASNE